jgi:multisubunit Na+/H+ antiporter MnhF subunit
MFFLLLFCFITVFYCIYNTTIKKNLLKNNTYIKRFFFIVVLYGILKKNTYIKNYIYAYI